MGLDWNVVEKSQKIWHAIAYNPMDRGEKRGSEVDKKLPHLVQLK